MEFKNYKCPVCDQRFKSGDDVVVCPECGAPHHRDCYESCGHCFYKDKHSEEFSFEEAYAQEHINDPDAHRNTIVCPRCKKENPEASFYCNSCGFPLSNQQSTESPGFDDQQNPQNEQNIPPFGFGAAGMPIFDPLAGMKSDEKLSDDVTAGEMAKYVGKNTQYYLMVFKRIRSTGSSRFSFAAFLLSGAYFLYRKMYLFGTIASLLILGLTIVETMIQLSPQYRELYYQLLSYAGSANPLAGLTSQFSTQELMFLYSPLVVTLLKGVVMIFCGVKANRMYYRHCIKSIKKLKEQTTDSANINSKLEEKGGVNIFLAACIVAAYFIIGYIPMFF